MLLVKKTLFKTINENDYQVGQVIELSENQYVVIALLKTEMIGTNIKVEVLLQDVDVTDPLAVFDNFDLPMTQIKKYYPSDSAKILQVGDTVSGLAKGVQERERFYARIAGIGLCERQGQALIMKYQLEWITPWSREKVDQAVFKHRTKNIHLLNGKQQKEFSMPRGHLSLVR